MSQGYKVTRKEQDRIRGDEYVYTTKEAAYYIDDLWKSWGSDARAKGNIKVQEVEYGEIAGSDPAMCQIKRVCHILISSLREDLERAAIAAELGEYKCEILRLSYKAICCDAGGKDFIANVLLP